MADRKETRVDKPTGTGCRFLGKEITG